MTRAASAHWPRVFTPEPGCRPPSVEPRRNERVLHVCLRVPGDPQAALARALKSLTQPDGYWEVDWQAVKREGGAVVDSCVKIARQIRPTLIFIQAQTPHVLSAYDVDTIRSHCAPDCVIVQWDGDQHYEPTDPKRAWFVDLGRACDASLICNTRYPLDYADMGVRCGYLQIGVDADIWRPTTPDPKGPAVVLLASNYRHLQSYSRRVAAARMLSVRFPSAFAAYGYGWELDGEVNGRPFVKHEAEAPIYSKSLAAVSISIRADLPRYTSDRLFRCLASGALTLVEAFPDMAGLGLRDGINCLSWSTLGELEALVKGIVEAPETRPHDDIRIRARDLAMTHTWAARMGELAAIVEAIREEGRL